MAIIVVDSVTATQAPGASPSVPSQGLSISEIQPSVATSCIGSLPFASSVSVSPLVDTPLHPGPSVDESPASQARRLLAKADRLRGMALALDPTAIHSSRPTPEVPVQPTIALQAHHTTLSPLSLPQLLTASAIRAPYLPLVSAQHYALHATPSFGGQSLGLVGAQHPQSPLPGVVPVQQLLLPRIAPYTTQYTIYPSPLHQVQTPAYISQHYSQSHGYAGPHASTPGGVMVDPKKCFRAIHTAYVTPTLPAPVSTAVTSGTLHSRISDLERALRRLQGMDWQSY